MGLYIPPVDKYLKAYMFQHAALGFAMDSWYDRSGTFPLAYCRRTWSQEAVVACLVPPVSEQYIGHPFLPIFAVFSISPVYPLSPGDIIYSFLEPHPPNNKMYLIVELY